MEQFKHESLDLEGPAFRLVRLCQGNDIDIRCELFHALLYPSEEAVEYEALSYTWGGTEKPENINISGSIMKVTKNLYLALRHLRRLDEDRVLWIDAICINQDNEKERGHQVRQMAEIYNKATRVIIWLGIITDETYAIMDSMATLHKESNKYACNDWKASDKRWRKIWSDIQPTLESKHLNLKAGQHDGLELLLRQSWFKRVWILQEVANARAALIVCGPVSVSARVFAFVPSLVGINVDPHSQAVLDIMSGPSRKHSWWSQKRDLHTLLVKFSKCEASDPRDHTPDIYALLSISSDAHDSHFPCADYTKSMDKVIHDTTSFILSLHKIGRIYTLPGWTWLQFSQAVNSLSNEVLKWVWEKRKKNFTKQLLGLDNFDVNSKDSDGKTLLWWAVQNERNGVTKLLLKRNDINVNSKDNNGRTVLWWAVENERGAIIKILLGRDDIDVNPEDNDGWTLLSWAEHTDHANFIDLLFGRDDIDVNSRYGSDFMVASRKREREGHEATGSSKRVQRS